jgi:hypothetical protein
MWISRALWRGKHLQTNVDFTSPLKRGFLEPSDVIFFVDAAFKVLIKSATQKKGGYVEVSLLTLDMCIEVNKVKSIQC